MAEFPALPIWTDALLGDTQHLSAEQFGAYMLMLVVAWRAPDNALPDDDRQLAQITRLTPAKWKINAPILRAFWSVDNYRLRQKKLDIVKNSVTESVKQKSIAGRASALKRKETGSTAVQREANGEATNQNQNQNQESKLPKPVPTAATGSGFLNMGGGRGSLSADAIEAGKCAAPGWDIYFLENQYLEFRKGKPKPDNQIAAFVGWVKKFTKGKAP